MNKVCKTIFNSLIAIAMILGVCIGGIQEILALNWGPAFYYPENDSSQGLVYLETIEDAWEFAKSKRTSKGENIVVYLNSNRSIERPFYLGENESATIDMNGHYIKFRDPYGGYYGIENGEIFNLGKNSTLILKGSNPRTFGYEGWCYTDESTGELSISYDTKYMEVTAGGLLTNSHCYNTAGAIYMSEGAHAYLYNIAICGNEAMDRSGVADTRGMIRLAGDNAYLYMENSEISHNWGTVAGGIGVEGGTKNCEIVMVNSKVEYNLERTPNPRYAFGGAGLLISSYAKLTMDNSSISHNVSVNKVGGGIKASDGMEIVLNNNSHIDYNETRNSNDGGGIYADGVLKITGDGTGTISYNSSSNDGGGILINNDDCYISNVTINGNTAKTGAGIYIDDEDTTIENCTITNNVASGNGGGIYDDNDGNVIKNCTITGNKTTSGEGGGVYVYGTVDVELRGKNIITGNKKGDNDNNLYLDNWGLSKAYFTGSVDAGSQVGISSSSSSTRQVGDELYNYIDGTFLLDSNRNKYHLEYVSSDHELFIREGESTKYTVYVNDQELGKYHYGDKVVVSDNNFNPEKVFVEWDTVNSRGYTIPKERKTKSTFTIDLMPRNDVYIEAYYAKKLTGLTLKLDKPIAGSSLPNSILSLTNTTNESVYKTDKYEWLEVNEDGTTTPTSGTAKYNTSYAIKFQMQQDVASYWVFSESLKPDKVTIQYGDVTVQAKEVSVDSNGTLTVISNPIKTDLATITSFDTDSITVHKGMSKEELIAELPTYATGNSNEVVSYDSDNNPIYKKQIYTVNKEGITTELDGLLDENGKVVRPNNETGTVQVTLPVTAREDLKIGENVTYQVNVTVSNEEENITNIQVASISVPVGVTVDEFKTYLPSTTIVETSYGYTKEINVDKASLGEQLNGHLDKNGKLVKGNPGEYSFEIYLDVVTDENLTNTDNKQMKVTVNVINPNEVSAPTLSLSDGTYRKCNNELKEDDSLDVNAYFKDTDALKGDTIHYTIDNGTEQTCSLNESTTSCTINLSGVANNKITHTLDVWATKADTTSESGETIEYTASSHVTGTYVLDTRTIDTPELDKENGFYFGSTLTVKITNQKDNVSYHYSIKQEEEQYCVKNGDYDAVNGIILHASYQQNIELTVWGELDEGVTSEEKYVLCTLFGGHVTTRKVTINCSDTALYSSDEDHWSDKKEYVYDDRTTVTITAPTYENKVFEKWTDKDGNTLSTNLWYTYEDLKENQKIYAIYNPVITEINFKIPYPVGGEILPTLGEQSITATIGTETGKDITGYFDLEHASWLPEPKEDSKGNKVADYDTGYTLKLPINANQSTGVKYALANNIKVTVNGETEVVVSVDEKESVAYLTFPKTSSETFDLNRIISPESISVSYLDAYNAAIKQEKEDQKEISGDEKHDNKWTMLPKSVQLELDTTSKYQIDADVEWSIPSFDKTSLKAQTLTITGTVKIPSYVTNTKQISNEVTLTVNVEDPIQVDAPSSTVKTGTYKETQYVVLSSIEDAIIYYTLDGSEPTISSTLYEGAIEVTETTTIKAIAVKAGMINSEVSTFVITIDTSTPSPSPTISPTPSITPSPTTTPTASPTSTSEAKKSSTKKSSGWDDGGPFTTDSCGNVYDRWGNKIYEATSCNVGSYNLVPTDTQN